MPMDEFPCVSGYIQGHETVYIGTSHVALRSRCRFLKYSTPYASEIEVVVGGCYSHNHILSMQYCIFCSHSRVSTVAVCIQR